jgi:hypothetical protein
MEKREIETNQVQLKFMTLMGKSTTYKLSW